MNSSKVTKRKRRTIFEACHGANILPLHVRLKLNQGIFFYGIRKLDLKQQILIQNIPLLWIWTTRPTVELVNIQRGPAESEDENYISERNNRNTAKSSSSTKHAVNMKTSRRTLEIHNNDNRSTVNPQLNLSRGGRHNIVRREKGKNRSSLTQGDEEEVSSHNFCLTF